MVWLGEAETKQTAKEKFGFKRCIYTEDLPKEWPKILGKSERLICNQELKKELSQLDQKIKIEVFKEDKDLEQLRVIKNDSEVSLMQIAANAASEAHIEVMLEP